MKYRIEDGEVKMPVSELNRLNDEVDALQKREALVNAIEAKLKGNSVATEIEVVNNPCLNPLGGHHYETIEIIKESYSDIDGILKKSGRS